YRHSWLDTLVTPHLGYLSLWNNLAAVIAANLVPLERAPLVTTLFAAAAQVTPVALILWGRSVLWRSGMHRVLGVMAVLFAPLSSEIWLTVIGSQFFLSLICVLILIDGPTAVGRFKIWAYGLLLALAGLTGALSCFLMPLYFWNAWRFRTREAAVRAGILATC